MTYTTLPNGNLRLCTTQKDELADVETASDAVDTLLANSDLCWISPTVCGDLTDAPILAILEYPEVPVEAEDGNGYVSCGRWDGQHWSCRVAHRWGWMEYATRDLADELLEKGEATLTAP